MVSVVKARTALDETTRTGAFQRTATAFHGQIGSPEFPAESGRYHLYISYACPWATRCLAVRNLKGLENAIGLSVAHPTWQRTRPDDPQDEHAGWVFRSEGDEPLPTRTGHGAFMPSGLVPDTVNGARDVRELYERSNDQKGTYSVPVLWDKKTSQVVNNESSEIIRMFNSAFNEIAANPDVNIYPEDLRKEIDATNEWVYPAINNGVYRCGFARSQEAYDTAVNELFTSLDRVEDILSNQRYIAGDRLTEADIRLFMTLVRFDEVYVVYFKTNCKRIEDYHNMFNYCCELHQMPWMQGVTNMVHIKMHYFTSHPTLNHYGIIPKGGDTVAKLLKPHDRDRFRCSL